MQKVLAAELLLIFASFFKVSISLSQIGGDSQFDGCKGTFNCLSCHSDNDDPCETLPHNWTEASNIRTISCDGCCVKTDEIIQDRRVVERGCSVAKTFHTARYFLSPGCYRRHGGVGVMCLCGENDCNHSRILSPPLAVVSILGVLQTFWLCNFIN